MTPLLDSGFTEDEIQRIIEDALSKHGSIANRGGGMCGSVYFFDQGEGVNPRWVVAKVPRSPAGNRKERNRRFLREIELQHNTFYHKFVCWPFDYKTISDTPLALYRAADGDLSEWIPRSDFSTISRLSVLIYLCSALRHCRSRGIQCHQDLKPQNILMQDINKRLRGTPKVDVFTFPQLADFGLANIGIDHQNSEGARPYMAPEQWLDNLATAESDIFALGVIIFEVMTSGSHPFGGITREWWPEPASGNSRKWLRPETWKKWAKEGTPITQANFLVQEVEEISRKCMANSAKDRPSLDTIQHELLTALEKLDSDAAGQAKFQALHADNSGYSNEWPYRDLRLETLKERMRELDI